MIFIPLIVVYMVVAGTLGLVLLAIGKTWRYALLGFWLYLAAFETSLADEVQWQLVFIKDGEIVEHGEPHDVRRDCIRLGYMYMQTALNEHDEPQLEGFLCDRVPPRPMKKAELPTCTEPIEQCA